MSTTSLEETLERMVDERSMRVVLDTLVEICHGKAEHILANWGRVAQARDWKNFAFKLDDVSSYLSPNSNPDGCKVPRKPQGEGAS